MVPRAGVSVRARQGREGQDERRFVNYGAGIPEGTESSPADLELNVVGRGRAEGEPRPEQ